MHFSPEKTRWMVFFTIIMGKIPIIWYLFLSLRKNIDDDDEKSSEKKLPNTHSPRFFPCESSLNSNNTLVSGCYFLNIFFGRLVLRESRQVWTTRTAASTPCTKSPRVGTRGSTARPRNSPLASSSCTWPTRTSCPTWPEMERQAIYIHTYHQALIWFIVPPATIALFIIQRRERPWTWGNTYAARSSVRKCWLPRSTNLINKRNLP